MVKRNISFYERKKEIITKHELCTKGKLQSINVVDEKNVDIMDFCDYKEIFFNAESW